MLPDPDIDMIGAQDLEEEMQLNIGNGHVLYTGGAKETDELAEEMAKHFGMQVEVIVPPNHPRAQYVSPSAVEVLVLANPHLYQAAQKLNKHVPSHFYTLQLLQRNYQIAKKDHTIFTFGILEKDAKRVKGGTGWTVQLALDQGKEVYLFDILGTGLNITTTSTTIRQLWWLGASFYPGVYKAKPHPSSKQCCGWFPRSGPENPRRNSSLFQSHVRSTREH